MAHGREGPDIVANIRYVGVSAVRAVSDHEKKRIPDGVSSIDLERSHLNKVLVGEGTQMDALEALWSSGVKRPAAQAEAPFVQLVLSASPAFFRPRGQGLGQYDQCLLDQWQNATLTWLQDEYGVDLVHASIHLDEDTPHIHALVVPTYRKAARRPGKMKRGETLEAFEERKAVAASSVVRTAGRSSCEQWSRPFARRFARKSYHAAVENLGLGYGRDFIDEGLPSPEGKTTRDWVRLQTAEAVERVAEAERTREAAEAYATNIRATAAAEARSRASAFLALAHEIEAGTLRKEPNGKIQVSNANALRMGRPEIDPAISAFVAVVDAEAKRKFSLDAREAAMTQREAVMAQKEAQIDEDLREIRGHREWLKSMRITMTSYIDQLAVWLRRPDLPFEAKDVAQDLNGNGDDIQRDLLLREKAMLMRLKNMRDRRMTGHDRLAPEQPCDETRPGF